MSAVIGVILAILNLVGALFFAYSWLKGRMDGGRR